MVQAEATLNTISITKITTPVGDMVAGVSDNGIFLFDFEYRKMAQSNYRRIREYWNAAFKQQRHPYHAVLEEQLREYFSGSRKQFDLKLQFSGSEFQQSVWQELLNIPYGATRTYKQQSHALGKEKAIRAVAGANGENCIAIIVPCHRVIGEDGNLTGYAGGLSRKKWLLELEARQSGRGTQSLLF